MSSRDLVLAVGGAVSPSSFISSSTSYVTTAANTVTAPTGIQDGDLLIAVGFRPTPSGTTITPPTGFNVQYFENITDNVLFVASKVAASEAGNYTFTWSGAANNAISILVYRNATKVNTVGDKASSSSSATNTVSSITPTYVGTLLAVFGNSGTSTTIASAPGGMTQRSLTSNNVNLAVYEQATQAASATGTKEIVWNSAGNVGGFLLQITNESTVAPEFVASATGQKTITSGTDLVINKPTGTIENDLMIAVMATSTNLPRAWTGDTGWTEVADQNASLGNNLRVAYKVAGASEGSSYTFTLSSTGYLESGCILTYRYAAYDTIGNFTTFTNPLVLPSISPSASQSMLIAAGSERTASVTVGTPTSMTALVTDNNANAPSYGVFGQIVASGPVGTRSMAAGNNSPSGITLSIKPTRNI